MIWTHHTKDVTVHDVFQPLGAFANERYDHGGPHLLCAFNVSIIHRAETWKQSRSALAYNGKKRMLRQMRLVG